MVYPVSSQQIPAANTFQPGGSAESIRQRPEQEKQVDTTKPQGTETARSQASETRNNGSAERTPSYQASNRTEDNGRASANSSRGTELDIVV